MLYLYAKTVKYFCVNWKTENPKVEELRTQYPNWLFTSKIIIARKRLSNEREEFERSTV